jgi:hypothetical protein
VCIFFRCAKVAGRPIASSASRLTRARALVPPETPEYLLVLLAGKKERALDRRNLRFSQVLEGRAWGFQPCMGVSNRTGAVPLF